MSILRKACVALSNLEVKGHPKDSGVCLLLEKLFCRSQKLDSAVNSQLVINFLWLVLKLKHDYKVLAKAKPTCFIILSLAGDETQLSCNHKASTSFGET